MRSRNVSERFFELFWFYRNNSAAAQELTNQVEINQPALHSRFITFTEDFSSAVGVGLMSYIGDFLTDPPNEVYQKHAEQIDRWREYNVNTLFVAHSQGNLFGNVAYDYAMGECGWKETQLRMVHVAPPTRLLNGPYVLSETDIVINVLVRAAGWANVPDPNIIMPFTQNRFDNGMGHSLPDIYLNSRTAAYPQTAAMLDSEWNALVNDDNVFNDAFQVTMKWPGGVENLDMWVKEPDGGSLRMKILSVLCMSVTLCGCFVFGGHSEKEKKNAVEIGQKLTASERVFYLEGCKNKVSCSDSRRAHKIDRHLVCDEYYSSIEHLYSRSYEIDASVSFKVINILEIGCYGLMCGFSSGYNLAVLEDSSGLQSTIEEILIDYGSSDVCGNSFGSF